MQDQTGIATDALAENDEAQRPEWASYEDLASRLVLSLADATLTEEAVYEGCQAAIDRGAGGVLVRPSDIDLVKNWVSGTPVRLLTLTGYPGGGSTTAARLYEARDVLRRGAAELALTMNLGKLVSRKFLYLESELLQMVEQCGQSHSRLRAVFEVDCLQQDHVLIGIRLAKRTGVAVMELAFRDTSLERMAGVVRYVAHHARGKLAISVQARMLTLESSAALYAAGADSLVTPSATSLLDAWREELARRAEEEKRRLQEQLRSTASAPSPIPSSE